MARVLVVGAGALGSLLGALLQEHRHDVLLLSRADHARAVSLDGLLLTGSAYGEPRRIPVKAAPTAPPGFDPDLVILGVKTQDIDAALAQHRAGLGERAPIVALQNGLAQDEMVAKAIGAERAVAAVAVLDAEFLDPGHVDCARRGTLVLGGARAEDAARVLGDAVRVQRTDNARGARWTKLLVNLSNVIPAITGLSYQQAAAHPGLTRANVRMVREGVAVAHAEGTRLESIPWTSPWLLRAAARVPEGLATKLYAARVRRVLGPAPAFGSTWQSKQRGASLETRWLNGEVSRRGDALGVGTPVNDAAVRLAEGGRMLSPDEAARELLGASR